MLGRLFARSAAAGVVADATNTRALSRSSAVPGSGPGRAVRGDGAVLTAKRRHQASVGLLKTLERRRAVCLGVAAIAVSRGTVSIPPVFVGGWVGTGTGGHEGNDSNATGGVCHLKLCPTAPSSAAEPALGVQ